MIFRNRLKYHLVKLLHCSNKQAEIYCSNGLIQVDSEQIPNSNAMIEDHQEIKFQNEIIRQRKELLYVLFNKPHGYECTTNRIIKDNIYEIIPKEFQHLFPLGRLDKNSEGLLMLTNDGKVHDTLLKAGGDIEKEYLVTTYFPITKDLEIAFTQPFLLGTRRTLPAKFEPISDCQFKVTLTEGINRQIRRICAKNGNQVKKLIRTRVGSNSLDSLKSGACLKVIKFF